MARVLGILAAFTVMPRTPAENRRFVCTARVALFNHEVRYGAQRMREVSGVGPTFPVVFQGGTKGSGMPNHVKDEETRSCNHCTRGANSMRERGGDGRLNVGGGVGWLHTEPVHLICCGGRVGRGIKRGAN